ncbi:amino acid ABC transporter permease [Sinorhizobium sp. GL28]|uniref:amino acid ABC transporter permease n=1 Tax=Sinorhizobium sp. GL28 TaxID=1358418 RepID=UPI00071D6091|nr:amino acid ABC transporter permease [Sinorhizobium sp. GL28]KSV84175.1 hypothetical protein N184_12845 [Sinorhizobium sp. GL28]
MVATSKTLAFVRSQEAPLLPSPANMVGVRGWLKENLFSSIGSAVITLGLGVVMLWLAWCVIDFAVISAVWVGDSRESCLGIQGGQSGACWPMVIAKLGQWIYGFYPIDQRWRVNICFVAFAAGIIPMLMPTIRHKILNAAYLFLLFPILTLVLLTGGNLDFAASSYFVLICFVFFSATALPLVVFGVEEGVARNTIGLASGGAAALLWLASFAIGPMTGLHLFGVSLDVGVLSLASGATSVWVICKDGSRRAMSVVAVWALALTLLLAAMAVLDFDFGLAPVETAQWGGLLVTLVVSVTGIVASLPLGIMLALARRSQMPVVRTLSVVYIEVIRGVPLITVLFMASVMLPVFLPPGVNFDKLLRALIGVALFSSAYMAEVVRGGLQAVPKGQYEGAMALGLSYWQMMLKIILPQALKISIPNIVGNFISLFKDTTLVLIVGIFDLLGIVQAGLRDAAWASPVSASTGYLTVALIYWAFCFGMSRYATFTERRLHTGHKR